MRKGLQMKLYKVIWYVGVVSLIAGCFVDKDFDVTSRHDFRLTAPTPRTIEPLKNYWGDLPGFYNRQAQASLDLVSEALCLFGEAEKNVNLSGGVGFLEGIPIVPGHPVIGV